MSTKLIDLAKAELEKTETQATLEQLETKVEDDKMVFVNEIHYSKRNVQEAVKNLAFYNRTPGSTPEKIINAKLTLKSAETQLEMLEAIFADRF